MIKKNIKSIRGMKDYLVDEVNIFQKIEKIIYKILFNYGYSEIRIPIIENASLFQKAIGEITDVVEKEMFIFKDKKNRLLCLRPEGTAGCVRAYIQNNMFGKNNQKIWYYGPMFRYERPQKGRYRQFYQLGVETFGYSPPYIDVELILISLRIWEKLCINEYLTLNINSIGSIKSREKYKKELVLFLKNNKKYLDKDCINRLHSNPLRILDSKNLIIQNLLKNAPKLINFISKKSLKNFLFLCSILDSLKIKYKINTNLVRGLDYYNDFVFEWMTDKIGAQNAICAGGRYDLLVQKLGGKNIASSGFAIGMERLLLLIKDINNKKIIISKNVVLFILILNKKILIETITFIEDLRNKLLNIQIFVYYFDKLNLVKKNISFYKNQKLLILEIKKDNLKKEKFLLKDISNKNSVLLSKKELLSVLLKF